MKKIALYSLSLLALGLFSCTDDSESPAAPQAWEEEASKDGVTFSVSPVSSINLGDLDESTLINVCSFSAPATTSGTISYEICLDKKTSLTINEKGQVESDLLQEAVVALYGKRPEARTMKAVVSAFINFDGQVTRHDGAGYELTVTPKAPLIQTGYYLVGDMSGWDINSLIPFEHSGKDVYEDAIFTAIVEIKKADTYWKIIPQSNVDAGDIWIGGESGVLGTASDGCPDATGKLVTDNPQAGKIENAGFVRFTLDMMEYTYTIEPFEGSPYLYVVGNHQDWKPELAGFVYSTDMINYQAFTNLDGEFKFTSQCDWNGTNYGSGGDNTLSTDPNAKNLSATTGFYLLKASIGAMTWSADLIETFGLIGSATEGSWDVSTPMTFDAPTFTYSVTANLTAGEFKFRANDEWTINLGGETNNLTIDGDNIPVTVEGTYDITLNLSDPTRYNCTLVKQ